MKKIAFVTPWYGENISGGAETELRGLIKHLIPHGIEIEVLTTCVEKFLSDWSYNYHKSGLSVENGVNVRRFHVRKRNTAKFDAVNKKLMMNESITRYEEEIYAEEMINSPELYKYLDEHKDEYGLFIFIPYMFGTTYYGCQIAPEKSILIPCLHDESYAYMNIFKDVFRKVAGMVFYAEYERLLAESLYGVNGKNFKTLGAGVDTHYKFNADRFRKKYNIYEPFILYAGRKDAGKNVDELIRYFGKYREKNSNNLKLVLIGGGHIEIPIDNVIDLGFIPVQDKYDAYSAATIFCNPSSVESFSIVIMESWLAGTHVIVNGYCGVTRDFVVNFSAGLYYKNIDEFIECINYLLENKEIAENMGINGKNQVIKNFSWDVITKKYIDYFNLMMGRIV